MGDKDPVPDTVVVVVVVVVIAAAAAALRVRRPGEEGGEGQMAVNRLGIVLERPCNRSDIGKTPSTW